MAVARRTFLQKMMTVTVVVWLCYEECHVKQLMLIEKMGLLRCPECQTRGAFHRSEPEFQW